MEVSIQTERKKKNTFNNSFLLSAENQGESQKDKKVKIKKLTQINKQLIETLKRQNDELTKKISKQKVRPQHNRSLSVSTDQSPKYMESTKKQLANAYKQIEMYKSVLTNLKAKEISTESLDKIKMLENKIKMEDSAIDQLQKELKFLRGIKEQQQKELEVVENDSIKKNVQDLDEEVKALKQKLKVIKKQATKREELEKKQHLYYLELQKLLRIQNDEYYPGKSETKKDFNKSKEAKEASIYDEISEKQWQDTRNELKNLKRVHEQNNKKIELLSRQKNKEVKSHEENEIKLKDKQKRLQQVRSKLAELTKLVTIKEKKEGRGEEDSDSQEEEEEGFATVTKNGKKSFKQKDPNKEREVKRWVIPQGYALEKGKILPDSIFFSDKTIMKNVVKSRIVEVRVWTDAQDNPCTLQFFYACEKGKRYEGIQPYPGSNSHLEENVMQFKEGDYLYKIEGVMEGGYLTSLTLVSKFGKKRKFSSESDNGGDPFQFEPRPNELPSCLFGAIAKNQDDEIRVCHLGCEFISNW